MTAKEKNLGRNVRFNLKIANYRPGQIVRYGDMPDGHRFWVDNKSILGAGRICEFTDEKPESVSKSDSVKTSDGELIIAIFEKKISDLTAENEKLMEQMAELDKAATDSNTGNEKLPDFMTNDYKKTDPETETKRGRGRPSTKTNEKK